LVSDCPQSHWNSSNRTRCRDCNHISGTTGDALETTQKDTTLQVSHNKPVDYCLPVWILLVPKSLDFNLGITLDRASPHGS
jgi:hypothetical protein